MQTLTIEQAREQFEQVARLLNVRLPLDRDSEQQSQYFFDEVQTRWSVYRACLIVNGLLEGCE